MDGVKGVQTQHWAALVCLHDPHSRHRPPGPHSFHVVYTCSQLRPNDVQMRHLRHPDRNHGPVCEAASPFPFSCQDAFDARDLISVVAANYANC
eukprot:scaffold64122_cov24-Prasinocladus_malaysianus.AAC.1